MSQEESSLFSLIFLMRAWNTRGSLVGSNEINLKEAKANLKNDKGMAAHFSRRPPIRIWRIKRPGILAISA
ncbi:MAG TPA: hypothetical protein DCQ59_01700 [Verrucomicrobiales bacterium]|nr:hypothetical protein [Verrucomicrobiales bacterium]